jgi:hypothetical protein
MLGGLQFEASKFETRTMPTPDLKGKEVIYWIKVETQDRRIATDLLRFLNGAPKLIELKVPSAFIVASTELETYRPQDLSEESIAQGEPKRQTSSTAASSDVVLAKKHEPSQKAEEGKAEAAVESEETKNYVIEIVLRRTISGPSMKQTQSPYG